MGALEAVQAEAATDAADVVRVPLGDDEVEVLPVGQWRSRGLRAMRDADFETWAETCCTPAGHATWVAADPTLDECEQFFTDWKRLTGQDPGKSRSSSRPSTTRKPARR